jgi:hypothetical protein
MQEFLIQGSSMHNHDFMKMKVIHSRKKGVLKG